MKLFIFTTTLLLASTSFAETKLLCRGTVDKSVKIKALLSETKGTLHIQYKKGDKLIDRKEPVTLASKGLRHTNYRWETPLKFEDSQYILSIRGYIVLDQLNGTTEDIELEMKPPYYSFYNGYDLTCNITQN